MELQTEKACLIYELEQMKTKASCEFSSGEKLDNLLTIGKKFGDKSGLGYISGSTSKLEHGKFMKGSELLINLPQNILILCLKNLNQG